MKKLYLEVKWRGALLINANGNKVIFNLDEFEGEILEKKKQELEKILGILEFEHRINQLET